MVKPLIYISYFCFSLKIKSLLISAFIFGIFIPINGYSQNSALGNSSDTNTLESLNNALFQALITNEKKKILALAPTYEVIDSFMRSKDSTLDYMNTKIRYAQVLGKVNKQYKLLRKKVKNSDFFLKNSNLDSTDYGRIKSVESTQYCAIRMYCSRKEYLYEIDYLAFNFLGNWYIAEKLQFNELRKKPKKKVEK